MAMVEIKQIYVYFLFIVRIMRTTTIDVEVLKRILVTLIELGCVHHGLHYEIWEVAQNSI